MPKTGKMIGWWVGCFDVDIVCNHEDELCYIQLSLKDMDEWVVICSKCGQKYKVTFKVELASPL